jgi:hypothetical protein
LTTALLLAFFVADVTPPVGHPLCGGLVKPVVRVADPLSARGFVLIGAGKPIVLCAVDWCEIHNDAYDRWRSALAEAAGTTPQRVMVMTLHQHDAPVADLEARRLLEQRGERRAGCDPAFHEQALRRVADAVRAAMKSSHRITHIGVGQAKVERVASNRRIVGPDGKVGAMRGSSCRDEALRAAPEGLIDPWLKTISFWDGGRPIVALSCYATHPMSYYGQGEVSSDFFGLARARCEAEDPSVAQILVNGCAGNIGAGKYNDGSPAMRSVLTDRVYRAMAAAWKATQRYPLGNVEWRVEPLALPPKTGSGFTREELRRQVANEAQKLAERIRAAEALSWLERAEAGRRIDVPVLDFGRVQVVLLPGEPFIEYQLAAQRMRPDSFVMVVGYGDAGPAYVPTNKAFAEGGYEVGDWSFVRPGAEDAVMTVLRKALQAR